MTYRAIILDLDGTLLDTLEDLATSYNRTLSRHGFPTHAVDAYRYFVGDGAAVCMERALPEGSRDADTVRSCLGTLREENTRNWKVTTRPYDGVPEMLDALVTRRLKLAALSNKTQAETEACVEEFLADWQFEMVAGIMESRPRKPDPSGALEIAARLAVDPGEFLFLGDTATDMQTAVAAKMFPVGALWGFRTSEELLANGARAVIERGTDMIGLLD